MASSQQLKRRISSAADIAKITKAMEAVAASKMRRAQEVARAGGAYQRLLSKMAKNIRRGADQKMHPLLSGVDADLSSGRCLVIVVATDRGLCGPLNNNLFRLLEQEMAADTPIIAIGDKANEYFRKTTRELVGSIAAVGDFPTYRQIQAASIIALEEYVSGRSAGVFIAYQRFVNTLTQTPTIEQLLPIFAGPELIPERVEPPRYIFEPETKTLLEELLPYSIRLAVYQAVLSAKAAEQSARMVSMKSASENADEVKNDLYLAYNKKRQSAITAEISDVVTATLALA